MAAACDRLVHASVVDAGERRCRRRFVGAMLVAPFLVAAAAVVLVTARLGASATLAVIFATVGLCWLTGLLVAQRARMAFAGILALVMGALGLACLTTAAGGLSSPVALLALALPVEAFWIGNSRRAALFGGVAAISGLALPALVGPVAFPEVMTPQAWQWLLPLVWGGTLVARFGRFSGDPAAQDAVQAESELEAAIDGVVVHMGRQGEVLSASAQARTILMLVPELLAGSGLFDRIHLSDRVAYLNALADLREGATLRRVEMRVRLPQNAGCPSGGNYQPFVLDLTRAPENDDGFIALLRRNDELVDMRDALAAASDAAAAAEIAKSRFLAAVSHELRTPLNAIIGFSDMLLHEMFGAFSDPRQKEYVGLVRESGHHLLEVVTSILDVSRIEAGTYAVEPEPFRFAEAVDMCRDMMQVLAQRKTIRLDAQVSGDAGEINADRRAVQQILINLASNAIKFTLEGGEVVIGARRIGSRLHFWVRDTGIGIAEENLANLGKPFTQIHNDYTRRFEGTGLGLSLVKGLVALHEGTMSIESTLGEGTIVSISLPVEGPRGISGKLVRLEAASADAKASNPEPESAGESVKGGAMKEGRDGAFRKTA
ncbi:PAS domain-containing sensor histidine kinase [Pseudaminobacter manganicus]|uniref:histidine kinase n=1 Tax=Manganibacter manganicus TaxID=1873176 RepID=A0A1V8RPV6_9HYPH|nr:PAS domain-containing sensor histidine kinase [Pseudaminobacter manganicus]